MTGHRLMVAGSFGRTVCMEASIHRLMVAWRFWGTVCMEASIHCVLVYFEIPHSFIIWQE